MASVQLSLSISPHLSQGGLCHLQVSSIRLCGGHGPLPGAPGPGEPHRVAGNPQRKGSTEARVLQAAAAEQLKPIYKWDSNRLNTDAHEQCLEKL